MKNKIMALLFCLPVFAMTVFSANAKTLQEQRIYLKNSGLDTENPMYMVKLGDVLSETDFAVYDGKFGLGQKLSYGFSNRFYASMDVRYQEDFNGYDDGFSNLGLSGVYRLSENKSGMTYDLVFGARFFGSDKLENPELSNTTYNAGLRVGYDMSFVTLSATLKSIWIFDEVDGISILNFTPEAYFRISEHWTTGLEFDYRQSTNFQFDEQWLGWKLGTRYGRTQYFGKIAYDFESGDVLFGGKVNILF